MCGRDSTAAAIENAGILKRLLFIAGYDPGCKFVLDRAAAPLDLALGAARYLVEDRFTVTDIIVGYTMNSGRLMGYLDGFANLHGYLDRLFARPHCTLDQS